MNLLGGNSRGVTAFTNFLFLDPGLCNSFSFWPKESLKQKKHKTTFKTQKTTFKRKNNNKYYNITTFTNFLFLDPGLCNSFSFWVKESLNP
jgi:hypothetical protein